MPFSVKWEPNGIKWIYFGHVTAEEVDSANDKFYSNSRSDSAKYQIIDALGVTSIEWSDIHIKKTVGYDIGADKIIKNLRVAFIADKAEVIEKMEKYIEVARRLNSSWQFKKFRDLQEAQRWVMQRP